MLPQGSKEAAPGAVLGADNLIIRALAPNVFVCRNGGEHGDIHRLRKAGGLPGAVILVDDEARYPNVAPELSEVLHGITNVVGDI